jgi:hypothetical protein
MRFFKWSSRSPRRSPQPAIASAKAGGEGGSERSNACRAVALAKAGGTSPSPQGTPGSTPFSKGLCSASLQAGILFFTLRSKGRCPSRPGWEASISPLLFRVPRPCATRKGGSFFSGSLSYVAEAFRPPSFFYSLKSQISNLKSQISNLKSQISNLKSIPYSALESCRPQNSSATKPSRTPPYRAPRPQPKIAPIQQPAP